MCVIVPVLTLREALTYDPETGLLLWRERPIYHFSNDDKWSAQQACSRWNTRYAGTRAFEQQTKSGYLSGVVDGERLLAHRVAWAITMGVKPSTEIDHRNGVRSDNRLVNLRLASRSEQNRNKAAHRNSTSSYLGVSYRPDRGKWRANIFVDGKQVSLGSFEKETDAARAYDVAARQHHGAFSRLNFPPATLERENQGTL